MPGGRMGVFPVEVWRQEGGVWVSGGGDETEKRLGEVRRPREGCGSKRRSVRTVVRRLRGGS